MTSNQINFARLKEESRANRAQEGIKTQSLSEEQRHNLQTERINWFGADTARKVGTAQAGAAASQAQAALSQAATQSRKQDFEESKYSDTGGDWVTAQTNKLNADAYLAMLKGREYKYYTPEMRGWMQQTQDWSNIVWSPVKGIISALK